MRLLSGYLLFTLLILATCASEKSSASKTIELDAVDGKTVFELLAASHEVEFKQHTLGVFIIAIDSVKNSGNQYWGLYINGEPVSEACDKITVSADDKIEWRYK